MTAFEEVQMPDGTAKGRKMWRAISGLAFVAFYSVGRKGQFWVTWGATGVSGGERAGCREDAENKASEILRRLTS